MTPTAISQMVEELVKAAVGLGLAYWMIQSGELMAAIGALAAIPLGAQYEIVDGFTALGQVRLSFPLSFFRKAVYFAALFILPACFGARAAFYAEPVSDVLGPLASAIAYKLCIGPCSATAMPAFDEPPRRKNHELFPLF